MRSYADGWVVRVPGEDAIAQLHQRQPKTQVKINAKPGQYLHDLELQDAYSYVLTLLDIGGENQLDLLRKYSEAVELLPFDIQPLQS